jgi:HAD superfamily hydrolase (TIGR01509 family)
MIRCLIFDCDGTLVDSEFLCNLGLEIQLRHYGVAASAHKMMERFRGEKLAKIIDELEAEYQVELKEGFVSSYREIVDTLFEERLKPCIGVAEMLSAISLPMCVASSGPLNKINKALTLTGLSGYFNDNIFSSYDVGSWKPEPGIFLHAAKAMGFAPQDCAVIEDSPVGITAAQRAGMRPILYDPTGIHAHINGVYKIRHMKELKHAIA